MNHEDAYCELSFSPNVSLISTVRRFVGEFYEKVLGDEDLTSRLEVATHELLENAVRYSTDGKSSIRVGVGQRDGIINVSIETRNRTRPENEGELVKLLDEMKASGDRLSFYQVLLGRSANRTEGSGLGLGRIHAESEMDLTCKVEEGIVSLRAHATFPARPH